LAKDYPELREIATVVEDTDYFPFILAEILDAGGTALYELPQGFPLSGVMSRKVENGNCGP
jgi:hypothetical protein